MGFEFLEGGLRRAGVRKRSFAECPLITIITVSFNAVDTLRDTIESIRSQSYGNIEYIVIDGGSSDGTVEVLNDFNCFIDYWTSRKDQGIYDAMNKGIDLAAGDIVGILNADDIYSHNQVLENAISVFSDMSVDMCFADLVYVDRQDTNKVVRYWQSHSFRPGLFSRGWMPPHPTFFVRRNIYTQYGGFDLAFPRQADFELTMRFFEVHKLKSRYVREIWVRMRVGGVSNNSLVGVLKGNFEAYQACLKNGINVSFLPFILQKIGGRLPQFFKRPKPEL